MRLLAVVPLVGNRRHLVEAGEKLEKRCYHRVTAAMAAIVVVQKRGGCAARQFACVAS